MTQNLNPEEKKILVMWGVVGIIVFLLALGYKFIYIDSDKKESIDENYSIVTNYDRYYTVMGAINKFYAFYNAKSYESILHILSSNYIKENSITIDNVKEYFPENDVNLSFTGKVMCSKNIGEGITSYLIEGNEKEMNTGNFIQKKYYNVVLDGNQFHFSLEPIEQDYYGGNCNG